MSPRDRESCQPLDDSGPSPGSTAPATRPAGQHRAVLSPCREGAEEAVDSDPVSQAADRPGRHRKLLRKRCASLTGVVIGDADGSRPSLRVVPRRSTSGSARR